MLRSDPMLLQIRQFYRDIGDGWLGRRDSAITQATINGRG